MPGPERERERLAQQEAGRSDATQRRVITLVCIVFSVVFTVVGLLITEPSPPPLNKTVIGHQPLALSEPLFALKLMLNSYLAACLFVLNRFHIRHK